MTASTTSPKGGRRTWWIWLVLLAFVGLTVVLTPETERPYSLRSSGPEGYRGLKLLLEGLGTEVDETSATDLDAANGPAWDVAYVPVADSASAEIVAAWRSFVEAGGRLVLGTPSPELGSTSSDEFGGSFGGGASSSPDDCSIDQLSDVGSIDVPFAVVGLDVGGAESCFGDGDQALVTRTALGDGEVFTLASPDLFVNTVMGAPEPDAKVAAIPNNAVLAQRLLGQGRGSSDPGTLVVVTDGISAAPVSGAKTLTDFMPGGVKLGLLELAVAFVFYAVFRGRRNGRLVVEPVPVNIAGSAFVEAVGSLLERQGDYAGAAAVLRDDQCRELERRLGMPRNLPRHDLAGIVADRTGRDRVAVEALLTDPIETESALVALTRDLESLRQEALHV